MVSVLVLTAVMSVSTFLLMAYVSHKLVGGTLVCEPPEGYLTQWHHRRMERNNRGLTGAKLN